MALPTSPVDGQLYNENGKTWLYVSPPGAWTIAGGTPITVEEVDPYFTSSAAYGYTEAPSDGTPYSRQDGGWVPAAAGSYGDADVDTHLNTGTATTGQYLQWNGTDYTWAAAAGSEVNDLTASVTWANIPDANVPQTAVTQHQAALSITESQISDLTHYTNSDVDAHLNQSTATTGQVLSWGGADYGWIDAGGVSGVAIASVATEPTATGTYSVAIGDSAIGSGGDSISIGRSSSASATDAIAIGRNANASSSNSISIGNNSDANFLSSTCVGSASFSGNSASAFGYSSNAGAQYSVSLGYDCNASATGSVALGTNAQATSTYALVINAQGATLNTSPASGEILLKTPTCEISFTVATGFELTEGGATARLDPSAGVYIFPNLPTADPAVAGQLWNNSGVLTVSAG